MSVATDTARRIRTARRVLAERLIAALSAVWRATQRAIQWVIKWEAPKYW
jgi:hypothetical protein